MIKIKLLQSSRSVLLLFIVFTVALFLGINQSGTFLNTIKSSNNITEIDLISDRKCDPASKPCMATGEDLSMSLQVGPDIGAMKKFNTQVIINKASDLEIENVRIEFTMLDMNMPQNKSSLDAHDGNTWKGSAILPVCVSGRMDWVARVIATSGSNEYVAEYGIVIR